jgi:hypothetical protein
MKLRRNTYEGNLAQRLGHDVSRELGLVIVKN